MKFGGTSVESAAAIERVVSIVEARLVCLPVVVVSAMGKTTDRLLAIAANAGAGKAEEALGQVSGLRSDHEREAASAVRGPDRDRLQEILEAEFGELAELVQSLAERGEWTPRAADAVASYGERLSSRILALALCSRGIKATTLDARQLILTDRRHTRAAPLLAETYARLARAVAPLVSGQVVVLGGFIGATEDGVTTTLGRGGSDFTAAIVGAGLGAEEIQIWTDVDGFLTADPNLVSDPHPVRTITFDEAAELAYFGARVLHPATVVPAREKNIPVRILNSRRPEAPGTQIVAKAVPCRNPIKSIACKRNITVVNIRSTRMLMAHGFLHRIFEIFDRYETSVDMLATSEVSVSLTIDNAGRLAEICDELRTFSEVSMEEERAILCVVSENLRLTPGVAARFFKALEKINVLMISQGASRLNLGCVVAEEDLPGAVACLHREFFDRLDPAVFG
jgi:aspartate kinase